MDSLLMPCPAALLRPGLPVITPRGPALIVQGTTYLLCLLISLIGEYDDTVGFPIADVSVDIRAPSVRDAVARALISRLAPPEHRDPVWPGFLRFDRSWEKGAQWDWEVADWPGPAFASELMPQDLGTVIVVPALADVPLDSPDRDLYALAAIVRAVLS